MENFYLIPPLEAPLSDKLGWISSLISQGESELRASSGYQALGPSVELLMNVRPDKRPELLSSYKASRTSRQALEILATLSDVRPSWEYRVHNKTWQSQCDVLNKYFQGWWWSPDTDSIEHLFQMLQWAMLGEGWLSVLWEPDLTALGPAGLRLHTYGPEDVIVSDWSRDKDIQKSYAVAIRQEMPLSIALELYPEHRDWLLKSSQSGSPSWLRRALSSFRQVFDSPLLQARFEERQSRGSGNIVELFHIYIRDFSINTSGASRVMGQDSWAYRVPSLGSPVPTGVFDKQGNPVTRPATKEEARLYPNRRMIIATRDHIISDGPSPWWHGLVPLVRFALKDFLFDRLGVNIIAEGDPISRTEESLVRGLDDLMSRKLRPPLKVNRNRVSRQKAEELDVRIPGTKLMTDSIVQDDIAPLLPWEMSQPSADTLSVIQDLRVNHDYIMGVPDVRALAEARQVPSDETMEKFMQLAGPIVKHYGRMMSRGLQKLGMLVMPLIFQFSTAKERFTRFGPEGTTPEDFDFDPVTLFPSDFQGLPVDERLARMREFTKQFYFSIETDSVYQISDMQEKMIAFQLWRDPKYFPLDPWSFAKKLKLDIGPEPEGTSDMISRSLWWMKSLTEFQAVIAAQAQVKGQEVMMQSALGPLMQAAQQGEGSGRPPGRPPSGQEPPRIREKEGGARSTISESG